MVDTTNSVSSSVSQTSQQSQQHNSHSNIGSISSGSRTLDLVDNLLSYLGSHTSKKPEISIIEPSLKMSIPLSDDSGELDLSWNRSNSQYKKVLTGLDTQGETKLTSPSSPRSKYVKVSPLKDGFNLNVGVEKAHVQYTISKVLGTLETVNSDSVYSSKGILVGTNKGDDLSLERHQLTKKLLYNNSDVKTKLSKFKLADNKNDNITKTPSIKSQTLFNERANIKLGKDDNESLVKLQLTQTRKGIAKFEVTAGSKSYSFTVGATSPTVENIQSNTSRATKNACAVSLPEPVPFYVLQTLSHFGFKRMANVLDPGAQVSGTNPSMSPHLNHKPISVGDKGFTFTPTVDKNSPIYPPLMRAQIEDAFDLIMKTKTGRDLINALTEMGIKNIEHRFSEKGPTVDWDHDHELSNPSSVDVKYFMKGDPTRSHHYESVDLGDKKDIKFQTVTAPMARVIFHELVHAYHTKGTTEGRKLVDHQVEHKHEYDEVIQGTWSNTEEFQTITGVTKDGMKDPINENAFLAEIGVLNPRSTHKTGKAPMVQTTELGNYVRTGGTQQISFEETFEAYGDTVRGVEDSTQTVKSYSPESIETKLKFKD
ncbi:M91 family zinc metallopeptidase [uncultured Shewanella sp.]|uniref:M91 family zinc metallopeptidase n=1 Tax=uncultured Shewanella sp. TaxID=173975 RepID=UPI002604F452|nr:M91 family zinc metallopeptidase [uncultured Shewanella sp.]